jgi:hypothetical protein
MKIKSLISGLTILAMLLGASLTLRAQPAGDHHPAAVFRDSTEAKLLRDAYVILATGDHDYNGHRVGAMQQVRSAADLLGMEVSGDANAKHSQALSDERLREAKRLIVLVLDSAYVKDQKKVVKRLNEAVHQINLALGIK